MPSDAVMIIRIEAKNTIVRKKSENGLHLLVNFTMLSIMNPPLLRSLPDKTADTSGNTVAKLNIPKKE
jgi:hypothetical protein